MLNVTVRNGLAWALALLATSTAAAAGDAPRPAAQEHSPSWTLFVAGGGAVLMAAGGGLYLKARADYDLLATRDPSITTEAQIEQTAGAGRAFQAAGFALLGVGAVALASGLALRFLGNPFRLRVSVELRPQGAGLGLAGALP